MSKIHSDFQTWSTKMLAVVMLVTIVSLDHPTFGQDVAKQEAEFGTEVVVAGKVLDIEALTTKRVIEGPLEVKLAKSLVGIEIEKIKLPEISLNAKTMPDRSKMFLEAPVKSALVKFSQDDVLKVATKTTKQKPDEESNAPSAEGDGKNPTVKPGDVKWHKDLKAACIASEISDKPVLHFQLLGQLDQRFT